MTEQEAIKELKECADLPFGNDISGETAEVAIHALEEIQQYRALGTVEELRELKESSLSGLELANIWASLEKLKKYEETGTAEELLEAREKQKEIEDIVNMQLIAGKNNYKEIYSSFNDIVKVIHR